MKTLYSKVSKEFSEANVFSQSGPLIGIIISKAKR